MELNSTIIFFLSRCLGTNRQKKQLFVMAVRTPSRKTLPGNLAIIPSEQSWVFHAIYQYASEVDSKVILMGHEIVKLL